MLSNSSLKTIVSSLSKFAINYPTLSVILSLSAYSVWNSLSSWLSPSGSRLKMTSAIDEDGQDQDARHSGPNSLRISIKNSTGSRNLESMSPETSAHQSRKSSPAGQSTSDSAEDFALSFEEQDVEGRSVRTSRGGSSPVTMIMSVPTSSPISSRASLSIAFQQLFQIISLGSQILRGSSESPGLAPSAQEKRALKVLFENLKSLETLRTSPNLLSERVSEILSSTQAHFFYFAVIAPEDKAREIGLSMMPHMLVVSKHFESQGYAQWSSVALNNYPQYASILQTDYTNEIPEAASQWDSERSLGDLYTLQTEIAHSSVCAAQKAFAPLFYRMRSLTNRFEVQCWSALQSNLDVLAYALQKSAYTLDNTVAHCRSSIVALQLAAIQVEFGASFSQSHPIQLLEALRALRQLQSTLKAHYYALNSYKTHTYSQIAGSIPSSASMPATSTAMVRASVLPPVSFLEVYMSSSPVLQGSYLPKGYKFYLAPQSWVFTVESALNTSRCFLSIQAHPGKDSYFLTVTAPKSFSSLKKDQERTPDSYVYEVSLKALHQMWLSIQSTSSPLCLSEKGQKSLERSPSRNSVANPLSPSSSVTKRKKI